MSTFGGCGFALRANTVRSYATQARTFEHLVAFYGVHLSKPLSELDLCILMSVYATAHKVTILKPFLSAVADNAHRSFGPNTEVPRRGLFQQTRTGIEKFDGDTAAPARKAPVNPDDLCSFAHLLCRDTSEGARDWCVCLLAFFGLLRIREYMEAGVRVVRAARHDLPICCRRLHTAAPHSSSQSTPPRLLLSLSLPSPLSEARAEPPLFLLPSCNLCSPVHTRHACAVCQC